MTIDFGADAPSDVESVRRIDGEALSGSSKPVGPGDHTASWDVVSPTIRPIGFAVTVTDSSGKKLVDRPSEKTGADGKGGGADSFQM